MRNQHTSTCILRGIQIADLPQVVEWYNDREIVNNIFSFPFPANLETQTKWYHANIAAGDGRNAIFGILREPGGAGTQIIGLAMLREINLLHHTAQFGIFIGDQTCLGQGYAEQATRQILGFGFDQLGLNRIELVVATENIRAIRLYEKTGFVREGLLRQYKFIEGKFIDVLIMSTLRTNAQ